MLIVPPVNRTATRGMRRSGPVVGLVAIGRVGRPDDARDVAATGSGIGSGIGLGSPLTVSTSGSAWYGLAGTPGSARQVGRSAPSAAASGSSACGSAEAPDIPIEGSRLNTLATPTARTAMATTRMTAVVPTTSEIGPTMMIGRKLATETSMLRTPKTRPRTSSGRSSWSCVCAGIATKP